MLQLAFLQAHYHAQGAPAMQRSLLLDLAELDLCTGMFSKIEAHSRGSTMSWCAGYEPHSALPSALQTVFCDLSPLKPPGMESIRVLATSAVRPSPLLPAFICAALYVHVHVILQA